MASEHPHLSDAEERPTLPLGSTVAQHRALDVTAHVASTRGAGVLLESTGPLAELRSAEQRKILDDARRLMIARKGTGVVFEARTVVGLQHIAERHQLDLSATLSTDSNDARVDVTAWFVGQEIELQLKTGSDRYIRASLKRTADDVLVLVPGDVTVRHPNRSVTTALTFEDAVFDAPTRDELLASSRRTLERLEHRDAAVNSRDVLRVSLQAAVVDGLVAAALSLSMQVLTSPEKPIDWRATARDVVRSAAVSATSCYLAGTNAIAASLADGRAVDATRALRSARIAGCLVPHAIDAAFDVARTLDGNLNASELARRSAGHAGAALAELVAFKYVARLAARFGPLGIVVMMLGGSLVTSIGRRLVPPDHIRDGPRAGTAGSNGWRHSGQVPMRAKSRTCMRRLTIGKVQR